MALSINVTGPVVDRLRMDKSSIIYIIVELAPGLELMPEATP
ncbi:hypothetical protein [Nocardia sp. NPDC051463]